MCRMQAEPEAWQRVADAVIARRAHRGWTQIDVATNGGLSLDRVQAIEGAKRTSYRAATIAALERALEWEYGSVQAILAGGEPTERQATPPPEAPPPRPVTLDDLAARMDAVQAEIIAVRREITQVRRELADRDRQREAG